MVKKRTEIIIEIAQAHDGSLGFCHSFIDALAGLDIDTIKFQTHIANSESSKFEEFRVPFSYEDATRMDYWKRMEFSLEQWQEIKQHVEQSGKHFLSSPFSLKAVELLEKINISRYKIASGETTNYLMLDKIAKTKKPILLSSGMSSIDEITKTISFLHTKKAENISLFQCTTEYPTKPEHYGLNNIDILKERFNIPIGLSDHSGEIYASLAAVSLGAELIEVHVTYDKKMFGPDSASSLTLSQIDELVKGIRIIDTAINNPVDKTEIKSQKDIKILFGKTLTLSRDLQKNEIIQFEDLEAAKPGGKGIPASEYIDVIGKKISKNTYKGTFLTWDILI